MRLQVSRVHRRGRYITVTVRYAPGSGRVAVIASKGRRRVPLRVAQRNRNNTVLTFTVKLSPGHWTVAIECKPARGYAISKPKPQSLTIPR